MPASWPRNIVPHTEETLRALSTPAAIELYESSLDQPLVESDLAPAQRPLAEDLVKAGLFAREGGHLVRTSRHRRDPDGDVPGKVEHKRAILAYAAGLLDESEAALHTRGASATVMIGAASFADRPDVLARA
ncbi:MAG TPA: hypothetical protein VM370_00740, partial [Candidatus Thermoplasmatota archaeon]|nr:hypothetical protein [Candidatus Thermoplasmatota archaeon]